MKVKKCTGCNIEIDEDNCKKDRNICKICYNINRKKYNNKEKKRKYDGSIKIIEKSKIDNVNNKINLSEKHNNNGIVSTYENRANVVIGARNVGKTYYILKVLEIIGNKRPMHLITRSPNQHPNYKTSNEIKPISKYKGSAVIFDDM